MRKGIAAITALALLLCGCGSRQAVATDPSLENTVATEITAPSTEAAPPSETAAPAETQAPTQLPTDPPTEPPTEMPTQSPTESPTEPSREKRLIVIDAGHQGKGNKDKEPVGPGSDEMKTKVAAGTSGCVSGYDEYELNLIVALQLQQELENRGYEVLMIRTTHDVDISNAQRAQIANEANADAVIRIHCNSSDNPDTHGALTICQTKNNPYQSQLYSVNRLLAQSVIDAFCQATGCYNRGVWETDTMTGLNWCEVPSCVVELGFMSNPQEDTKMATAEYQALMVRGIADGLDIFFENMQK